MPREHAANAGDGGGLARHERERQELVDRDRVDLDAEADGVRQGEELLQLTGEEERALVFPQVQRPDAERVPQQRQRLGLGVPVRRREGAVRLGRVEGVVRESLREGRRG
jgi:hypothetical protein